MNDTAETTTSTKPKRWYIVHAYSNFENKVADSIREQAKQRGLAEHIGEVLVPKEKVTEARRGRKVETERKFFPGYVLVKMDLTDEVYHLIKNTPKVTGFLGTDKKPMPISDAEADRILHQVQEGIERPKPAVSFEVGEQVRVSDGPFARRAASTASSEARTAPSPMAWKWGWNPRASMAGTQSARSAGSICRRPRLSVAPPCPSPYGSSIAPVLA